MSTRAVIYARISHDATGEQAGVSRQIEACTHLAKAREWELVQPELVDNDISAYSGARRPAYEELLALIRDRKVDAVIAWHMDRMCRRVADLVDLLKLAVGTNGTPGVRVATVHGDLDLSSPIGRMFATILIAVAEYEAAHKGERHAAANLVAARNGKRRLGTPRPFGWSADDRTMPDQDQAAAIRWAADALLGGSTISAVMREWGKRGLRPPQAPFGPLRKNAWSRNSVTTIMKNPALAGLSVYRGEIVGRGEWEPILPEHAWQAIAALLDDPARKPPKGVRTMLGGLALCPCGNVVTGSVSRLGHHIYRCQPSSRDGRPGPHVAVRAEFVDEFVEEVLIERLSRADLADLIAPPPNVDTAALRTESAAIRKNLDQMAADAVLSGYSQSMLAAATTAARARLDEIGSQLAESAGASVLGPFLRGVKAAAVWGELDDSRRRAVIATLCTITLHPAGAGTRFYDVESKVKFGPPADLST